MWSSEYPQLTSCKHARGYGCVLRRMRVLKKHAFADCDRVGNQERNKHAVGSLKELIPMITSASLQRFISLHHTTTCAHTHIFFTFSHNLMLSQTHVTPVCFPVGESNAHSLSLSLSRETFLSGSLVTSPAICRLSRCCIFFKIRLEILKQKQRM